jgi:hypothetical protein
VRRSRTRSTSVAGNGRTDAGRPVTSGTTVIASTATDAAAEKTASVPFEAEQQTAA